MNDIERERKAIIIGGGAWGCALASVIERFQQISHIGR